MRIIVTGGAGFIGSHLVDALLGRSLQTHDEVVVIDNLQRGRLAHLAAHDGDPRLSIHQLDIRDADRLPALFEHAELVYHLAAQSNVMGAVCDPRYSFETNVAGAFNVLEAARLAGVRRVVFTSSREVYGDPAHLPVAESHPLAARNTYGASKVAAEAFCSAFATVFGLETAVLRFANVYGPRDRDRVIPLWIDRALAGENLDLFGGDQVVDFVPVDLAVNALLCAAEADIVGRPTNIATGVGTPLRELARRIIDRAASNSRLRVLPARNAEVRCFVADCGRMRTLIGLEPPADPLGRLADLIPTRATPARNVPVQ